MVCESVAQGRITASAGANLLSIHAQDRNNDATVYVGNIDSQADDHLISELFTQAGPVVNVYMPRDRVTGNHQGYGFVEFKSEVDTIYAIKILNMIRLYGKPLRVNKASSDKVSKDGIGANLFVGNLDPEVDEKVLFDTFSAFGVIYDTPKISRNPETGNSTGHGFVLFADFEAADAAIDALNGQYLMNRKIVVQYAYKRDNPGQRHGTPAERQLALQLRNKGLLTPSRPNLFYSSGHHLMLEKAIPTTCAPIPTIQAAMWKTLLNTSPSFVNQVSALDPNSTTL
jgi:splicing factor 3B subunit 4